MFVNNIAISSTIIFMQNFVIFPEGQNQLHKSSLLVKGKLSLKTIL